MKIFFSYSFRKQDQDLASMVKETLGAFGFDITTGEHLGGQALEKAIVERIDGVYALVSLFTLRPETERNESTLDWVKRELWRARDKDKFAIVLTEEGVPLGGPDADYEYIRFTRDKFDTALLQLAKKFAVVRELVGRRKKIQLLPPELAIKFNPDDHNLECYVEFSQDGIRDKDAWQKIDSVVYEKHGAFAYIDMPENVSFRIKVVEPKGGSKMTWRSVSQPSNQLEITLET